MKKKNKKDLGSSSFPNIQKMFDYISRSPTKKELRNAIKRKKVLEKAESKGKDK